MRRFFMPTTGRGYTNKRNRRDCKYYNSKTGFCYKIWNQCVGPTVCKKYQKDQDNILK